MARELELQGELVNRLRALHALKAGAVPMFDPMLAAVAAARRAPRFGEVSDLLGRMHGVFGRHRGATVDHARRLERRIVELGARPARGRARAIGAAAALRARAGTLGGLNFGSAAGEAFVFEHAEIARARLIEQLAQRVDDAETRELARAIRADDEEMAATIGRNWTNVLSLSLAASGLPVRRPPEDD